MITLLAQVPTATNSQLLTVIIGGAGVLGIIYLVFGTLNQWRELKASKATVNVQPVNAEFVTKADHKEDVAALKEEISEVRDRGDANTDRILQKLEVVKDDLNLQGSRRSKTLFDKLDEKLQPVNRTLKEHGEEIARIDERTKGKGNS